MDIAAQISFQKDYSDRKVWVMRIVRYFQTGYLLHLMTVFSILMVYFLGKEFLILCKSDGSLWKLLVYGFASTDFFFTDLF